MRSPRNDAAAIRRRPGRALFLAAFAALFLQAAPAGAATPGPATDFVKTVAVKAMSVLSDRSAAPADRKARFAAVIDANFDAEGIGRFVTGAAWQKADDATRAAFLKVFRRALVKTYTDRFFNYDGRSLQVVSTKSLSGQSVMVKSTVEDPVANDTYDVNWMVTGPDSGLKLFDVVVDGVSTTITTRDEYSAVLARNGGDLGKLTALIASKLG